MALHPQLRRARNLQEFMLRGLANTLVSVRRVTQGNTGRHTPGINGQLALTAAARGDLAALLHTAGPGQALPVRRVHIRRRVEHGHSGSRSSPIAPSSSGCVTRWNPSGRPGWTASNTASGRTVDAMTRSR